MDGLDRDALLSRMHVRLPDGRIVSGAAAFSVLWSTLPGLRWLGRLVGHPLVLPIAESVYRVFLGIRRLWRPRPASV